MIQTSLKIFLCFSILLFNCSFPEKANNSDKHKINFNHLDHLTQTVTLDNKLCDIIHIYAEYPDYNWVDASQEGITCVDDVARAAIVYLRYYEMTGIDSVLDKAKRLLNFILHMQTDDGEFYNFIDSDLSINKQARTSRKSFDFWAARGYWALGFGYKIFKPIDGEYAITLQNAFLRCKVPIRKILGNYGKFKQMNNRKIPLWLVNKIGSDATSALLLGLVEYLKTENDAELKEYATKLAEGILATQLKDDHAYKGAFLSWNDIWHAWGNAQTQALASLGKILQRQRFIKAAMFEADNFYITLLVNGMLREWQLKNKDSVQEFPQLSYDIRCLAVGLLRLYDSTNNEDYGKLAGLAASWLLGNNAAKTQMYDPATGRCFDGIIDSLKVNYNSGAESTIESLFTIIEISNNPIAQNYSYYKTVHVDSLVDESTGIISHYRIFENDDDKKIILISDLALGKFRLLEDKESDEFLTQIRQHEN